MAAYIKTYRYMIKNGVNPGKALLALQTAFALSPEQVVRLANQK